MELFRSEMREIGMLSPMALLHRTIGWLERSLRPTPKQGSVRRS
jgi:hypothetical protein